MDKPVRKMIPLDPTLWKRVEDFRFTYRIPSEAAAIRLLIERGLGVVETREPVAKRGKGK